MKPAIISLCKIALFVLVFMSVISPIVIANSAPKKLQIGVKKRPSECPMKSKKGDLLHMHYTVTILEDLINQSFCVLQNTNYMIIGTYFYK